MSRAVNILNRIQESPPPTDSMIKQNYYHGTSSKTKAEKIWKSGIKPDLSKQQDFGRAVEGMVYVTKNLGYALHYALGAAVAGTVWSDYMDKLIKRHGQYGYIAVVPGSELKDIHPDEDQIGEAVFDEYEGKSHRSWLRVLAERYLAGQEAPHEEGEDSYRQDLLHAVKEGDYDAWIVAGKLLLPRLSEDQKLELIEAYGNAAHAGVLHPSELWQIDRKLIPELNKDGSNFFKLAQRVH